MTYLVAALLLIIPIALVSFRSYRHKRHSFTRPDVSTLAIVDTPLSPQGSVLINGELWLARSVDESVITANAKVIVVGVRDHCLLVEVVATTH